MKARIVKGAAANLIFARKREDVYAYNFFSARTDAHLFTRSEHSQGGAQQSEQYLYDAQRAVQSRAIHACVAI